MRGPLGKQTYSNVMATIAVFIALGAGAYAAVNLPKNSVKSKHIKNAQVKNKDVRNGAINADKLNGAIKPLHFDGDLPAGSLNDVILEAEGYRVSWACEDAGGGVPRVDGVIRFPEGGTVDLLQTEALEMTESGAGQLPVTAAEGLDIGVPAPEGSATHSLGAIATYSGASRAALITVHGGASADSGRCTLTGSIVPLTQVE